MAKKKTAKKTAKKTTRRTAGASGDNPENRKTLRDALEELDLLLDDAYWAADTAEKKDRIRGVARIVSDLLSDLNKLEIENRTAEFKQMKSQINEAIANIKKIKGEINTLIQRVQLATKIVANVEKVIKAAASALA